MCLGDFLWLRAYTWVTYTSSVSLRASDFPSLNLSYLIFKMRKVMNCCLVKLLSRQNRIMQENSLVPHVQLVLSESRLLLLSCLSSYFLLDHHMYKVVCADTCTETFLWAHLFGLPSLTNTLYFSWVFYSFQRKGYVCYLIELCNWAGQKFIYRWSPGEWVKWLVLDWQW